MQKTEVTPYSHKYVTTRDNGLESTCETIYHVFHNPSGFILTQYNPDGWKALITPSFPNGMLFKVIDIFNTLWDVEEYLKKLEEI